MGLTTSLPEECLRLQSATLLECTISTDGTVSLQARRDSVKVPFLFQPFVSEIPIQTPCRVNSSITLLARVPLESPCRCLLVLEGVLSEVFKPADTANNHHQRLSLLLLHNGENIAQVELQQAFTNLLTTKTNQPSNTPYNVRTLRLPVAAAGSGLLYSAPLAVTVSDLGIETVVGPSGWKQVQRGSSTWPYNSGSIQFPSQATGGRRLLAASLVPLRESMEDSPAAVFLVVDHSRLLRCICVRPESSTTASLDLNTAAAEALTEMLRTLFCSRPLDAEAVFASLPDDPVHWHTVLQNYLRSLLPNDDSEAARKGLAEVADALGRMDPRRMTLQRRGDHADDAMRTACQRTWALLRQRTTPAHLAQLPTLLQLLAAPCLVPLFQHPSGELSSAPFADWLRRLLLQEPAATDPAVWERLLFRLGRLYGGPATRAPTTSLAAVLGGFGVVCQEVARGDFHAVEHRQAAERLVAHFLQAEEKPLIPRVREVVGNVLLRCVDQSVVDLSSILEANLADAEMTAQSNQILVPRLVDGVNAIVQPLIGGHLLSEERRSDIRLCTGSLQQ